MQTDSTTTAIIELHYLPNIQYFTKLLLYDQILIDQHENYQKGSYRNRCHLAGVNELLRLSIPLQKGKNRSMPIRDVKIAYDDSWQTQHWGSIRSAYGKAPFFEHYADYFRPFYQKKYAFLFDLNYEIFMQLLPLLTVESSIKLTLSYQKEYSSTTDLRDQIVPKKRTHQADHFFEPQKYPQVFQEKNGFLSNLSILDVLFCAGPQSTLILEDSIQQHGFNQ